MPDMNIQKRKKLYQTKQCLPPWLSDYKIVFYYCKNNTAGGLAPFHSYMPNLVTIGCYIFDVTFLWRSTLHTSKYPLCCAVPLLPFMIWVVQPLKWITLDTMLNIPRSLIWNYASKIEIPWITLMAMSHSYINTRGMMYDSSKFSCSEVLFVGNHGDWLLVRFVNNLAQWSPTKRYANWCRDGSVKK